MRKRRSVEIGKVDRVGTDGSSSVPRIIIRRIKIRDPHFTSGWIFGKFSAQTYSYFERKLV